MPLRITKKIPFFYKTYYKKSLSQTTPSVVVVNLVSNGTDWIDSNSDGLADNWTRFASSPTLLIKDGTDGFTGRFQRGQSNFVRSYCYIISDTAILTSGKTYSLSFKYRSNYSIKIKNDDETVLIATLPTNTGNAISYSTSFTYSGTTGKKMIIGIELAGADGYFEIDEVVLS